jgi:predicted MFS family arabinose efflux permease
MTQRQLKNNYFVLEGLNCFGTTYYFYYLFFYLQQMFGFGNLGNLFVSALNGFVYMFAAWYGGKFAQKYGYFTALRLGFSIMAVALGIGHFMDTAFGQLTLMVVWTLGMCFTWPSLEAMVSERETPRGLQRVLGIYNLVWSGVSAVAYFVGGALLEKLGVQSLFWVPMSIHLTQLVYLRWVENQSKEATPNPPDAKDEEPIHETPPTPARSQAFLRMAWLANPFAYVAVNTVVAVIPGVADKLDLSPMFAGFFCSIWMFARMLAFAGLWLWSGWHYRLRYFIGSYIVLMATFVTIVLVPKLPAIIVAQLLFGLALGLIYYSSLYYSMHTSDTKGEHGGLHEAAIGLGIFAGPAVGAAALRFFPSIPNSGMLAVSVLLLAGFGGMLALSWKVVKK